MSRAKRREICGINRFQLCGEFLYALLYTAFLLPVISSIYFSLHS
jgi:hypothetical protein